MGEYIQELRKVVGHRPLLQVGASVLIEDSQGRLLLEKRKDTNNWAHIGGAVELFEEVETTAKREVLEETGLILDDLQFFAIFSGEKFRFVYPNQDEVSNIDIVFLCKSYHGTLQPQTSEVTELRFFELQELPDQLFAPSIPVLEAWKKHHCLNKSG